VLSVWRLPELRHEEKHRIFHVVYRIHSAIDSTGVLLLSNYIHTSNQGYLVVMILQVTIAFDVVH